MWLNPRHHIRVHRTPRLRPGGSLSTRAWIAVAWSQRRLENHSPPRGQPPLVWVRQWGEPVPVSDAPAAVHHRDDSPIRSLPALLPKETPLEPQPAVHHAQLSSLRPPRKEGEMGEIHRSVQPERNQCCPKTGEEFHREPETMRRNSRRITSFGRMSKRCCQNSPGG